MFVRKLNFVKPSRRSASTFLYPDMNQDEVNFVQSQVDCITQVPWSEKSSIELFPPNSRKFLTQRVDAVQRYYKHFLIPKNQNDKYLRNLNSLPKLERTLRAMKWANLKTSEVNANPDVIMMSPGEIAYFKRIASFIDEDENASILDAKHLTGKNLHGIFALKYIKAMSQSLKVLSLSKSSYRIPRLDYAKFSPIRLSKMESLMVEVLLQEMSIEIPSLINVSKFNDMSVLNVARIHYLWRMLKKPNFHPKSLTLLDSTEMAIQLNALCSCLDLDLEKLDPNHLWQYLHIASQKIPISLLCHYFKVIGFTTEEIQTLVLSPKPVKFSSKSLPITGENYAENMKTKFEFLREKDPQKPALEIMREMVQ